VIPDFDESGRLPPGEHPANWQQVAERFGTSPKREELLTGLYAALTALKTAGCQTVYLDGSFVTAKQEPGDFDACWEASGVNASQLDPVLLDFSNQRLKQKLKYGGELFVASQIADPNTMDAFLDFFQTDSESGDRKGIVVLDLRSFP
jgi:hypothetical protein